MKISRLKIESFAIEESPTINKKSIAGKDLLLYGGNRSGKTLSFNALAYGLYGRSGTFGVTPGQKSKVNIHFDNSDSVIREGSHQYKTDGESLDANEGVKLNVGYEEYISLQFIPAKASTSVTSITLRSSPRLLPVVILRTDIA